MYTRHQRKVRTVDVVIDTSDVGGYQPLTLPNVPLPISFTYLTERLAANGMYVHDTNETGSEAVQK